MEKVCDGRIHRKDSKWSRTGGATSKTTWEFVAVPRSGRWRQVDLRDRCSRPPECRASPILATRHRRARCLAQAASDRRGSRLARASVRRLTTTRWRQSTRSPARARDSDEDVVREFAGQDHPSAPLGCQRGRMQARGRRVATATLSGRQHQRCKRRQGIRY